MDNAGNEVYRVSGIEWGFFDLHRRPMFVYFSYLLLRK